MNRRAFLAGAGLAQVARPASLDLDEITIDQLQEGMRSGRWTARSLAEHYLSRIVGLDKKGPAVNAIIELNPDALDIADRLDRERSRGPLHGIPVLIKDNIGTADRMSTSAGSMALAECVPASDAPVVRRLRAAGAVILGKTNLSEWANFRSTHSVSGWSGRGGQTRNPYALDRNPCGSSSGSSVAVAANLCVAAVGTETDGSIVCPASVNGIVGIKPTVGLLSAEGIVPIAHSQDTPGPMARTMRDAAILLGALSGSDYSSALNPRGLRGARLGVARKFFGTNAALDRVMEACLSEIRKQGAELVDPADLPSHGQYNDAEFEVLLYEFKSGLDRYLASAGGSVKSLADVIAFNEKHRAQEMPWFEQEILVMARKKGPLTDKAYLDALAKGRRLSRKEGIDAVIEKHRVDAIVAPTAGPAWLIDWINGDHDTGGCSTPAAVAGYPHVTVPAGFVHGLPVGISFFGAAHSEPVLIRLAYAFEQAARARRAPQFLPTIQPA